MARQIGWALAALVASGTLVVSTGSTVRAEHEQVVPQNRSNSPRQEPRRDNNDLRGWWKDPKHTAELGLTTAQIAEIDQIFRTEIEKMKPMRTHITEMERGVDATSRANTDDIEAYARQVRQVEHKRAELNTLRTVMLYRMRRVLSAEQNTKFQALHDRVEADRKKLEADRKKQDAERRR